MDEAKNVNFPNKFIKLLSKKGSEDQFLKVCQNHRSNVIIIGIFSIKFVFATTPVFSCHY